MYPRDVSIFIKAAQKFQAWIFVRRTNPYGTQYFGKRSYSPKPIDIKAKTADRLASDPDKKIEGLVADPRRWPEAFADARKAAKLWDDFCEDQGLGQFDDNREFKGRKSGDFGFAIDVEPGSKHEGCVTKSGMYLFGDHDLFDIVPIGEETNTSVAVRPTASIKDVRGSKWQQVADFLNGQFGGRRPMIQHGQHFFFRPNDEDVADFQKVYSFSPNGRFEEWHATKLQMQYMKWGRHYDPKAV